MENLQIVTAALLYANGAAHLGHLAGCYLPADIYTRFAKMCGRNTIYITGSDEYGVAIEISSRLAQMSCQESVDRYHALNASLMERLDISPDFFGRTTDPEHQKVVIEFYEDLKQAGLITKKESEQLYSQEDDAFLADRYVVGTCPKCGFEEARGDECTQCSATYEAIDLLNPRSKLSGNRLTLKKTEHLYLQLDLLKERLISWIEQKQWKPSVINYIMPYLENLRERCITRDSKWGIPVPDFPQKVFYVWFDAPIGYITMTKAWAKSQGDPALWEKYWLNEKTNLTHFIGKDNLWFHALFFPAMIMGQKKSYPLVDAIPANDFLNLEGRQFSKSSGWTLDTEQILSVFSADQVRFVLASIMPQNHDAEFRWSDFALRINSEFSAKFGNLCHRVLTFIQNKAGGVIPVCPDSSAFDQELQARDMEFIESRKRILQEMRAHYDAFEVREVVQKFMELSALGNMYFDANKPWQLAKDEELHERMHAVLYHCLDLLKEIAVITYPLIPSTANKLWALLGMETKLGTRLFDDPLIAGQKLPEPVILVERVTDEQIAYQESLLQGNTA